MQSRLHGPQDSQRSARLVPPRARLTDSEWASISNFVVSFQKAATMDFYITKYQGKAMESLTPLFMAMVEGIHRLEKREQEELQA